MLRIYEVALEVVRRLAPVVEEIGRKDPDLARQLRRAKVAVPLNIAEGSYALGGNRRARYRTAMGEAREALGCLEVAEAAGYARVDEETAKMLNRIIGTLYNVVR